MSQNKKILPPAYLLIYIAVGIILYLLFPIATIIHTPYTYLGIPIVLLGILLIIWSGSILRNRNTTVWPHGKSSALVTEGPFKFSRNPMYLGFVLILLGITILLGNFIVIFAPLAMLITMEILFIPYEENALEETFKEKYLEYKKRVRKWL